MSSFLHNPSQVCNAEVLAELSREIGASNIKPLSKVCASNDHRTGGSVSYLNYRLHEAHLKHISKDDFDYRGYEDHIIALERSRATKSRLPSI